MPRIRPLPNMETLVAAYPTPKDYSLDALANLIGNKVKTNLLDPAQTDYKDTCAIRVSRALNYSPGHSIKSTSVPSKRRNSGDDKKWYVFGVDDLRRYLNITYGDADVKKDGSSLSPADFKGEYGIIEFHSFHMDLWLYGHCVNQAYFDRVTTVRLWRAPISDLYKPLIEAPYKAQEALQQLTHPQP